MNWQLVFVEVDWFGKFLDEICIQLCDLEFNGDCDYLDLVSYLDYDLILYWVWNLGGGCEFVLYSLQEYVDDILVWGVVGYFCYSDN